MPYLELTLNGRRLATGGADQLDVLSLVLIANRRSTQLSLQLGGMRTLPDGRTEHLCWSRTLLQTDDQLRVAVFDKAVADQLDTQLSSSIPLAQKLETPLRTLQFDVEFSDCERFSALATEDTLQLVASWLGGREGCKVDVDSISAAEDGTTQGRRWVERIVRPGEWFEVKPHLQ